MKKLCVCSCMTVITGLLVSKLAVAASVTLLPEWFESPTVSNLFMLSDGRTFTGVDGTDVFRWSAAEGRSNLGAIPSWQNSLNYRVHFERVSDDGSTFIGTVNGFGCMWTAATGLLFMPDSPDGKVRYAVPRSVSSDGNVIVGDARHFPNGLDGEQKEIAFRWTAAGGTASLGFAGYPAAVSADGATVVGTRLVSERTREAFRWNERDGLQGLGFLSEHEWKRSAASLVSADGTVVFGESELDAPKYPSKLVRWSESSGMQQISPFGEYQYVEAVSSDATTMIGSYRNFDYARGVIGPPVDYLWTQDGGVQTLSELLIEHGLDTVYPLSESDRSNYFIDLSADGHLLWGISQRFVGGGTIDNPPIYHEEHWILDLSPTPEPSAFVLVVTAFYFVVCGRRRRF